MLAKPIIVKPLIKDPFANTDPVIVSSEPPWYWYDVAPGDSLYEIYRRGLLSRHLCSNGRVDEWSWLAQGDTTGMLNPRNVYPRIREERFSSSLNGEVRASKFAWSTLSRKLSNGSEIHWGGGENPLLTSGLALAFLSLEGLLGVSKQSIKYCHKIFGYMNACKSSKGFYLRQDSRLPEAAPLVASTDELLGICVGFTYYKRLLQAMDARGELHGQLRNDLGTVGFLINEVGSTLADHGGWYLPYADHWPKHAKFEIGRQTAWIFGFPLSLWLSSQGAPSLTTTEWLSSEWKRYFPEYLVEPGNILGLAEWGQAKAVKNLLPLPWYSERFFDLVCAVIKYSCEHADSPVSTTTAGALATLGLTGPLVVPATMAAEFVFDKLIKKSKENYYNFHMFALACILGLESGNMPAGSRTLIAEAMLALLRANDKIGQGNANALFAAVAVFAKPDTIGRLEVQQAFSPLFAGCRAGEKSVGFQHDLPLAIMPWLAELGSEADDSAVAIAQAVGDEHWREKLASLDLPCDFNPDRRWGKCRTFSNPHEGERWVFFCYPDDVETKSLIVHALLTGKPPAGRPPAIAAELCEVDLLFTRMIMARVGGQAHHQYLSKPALSADVALSTLWEPGPLPRLT